MQFYSRSFCYIIIVPVLILSLFSVWMALIYASKWWDEQPLDSYTARRLLGKKIHYIYRSLYHRVRTRTHTHTHTHTCTHAHAHTWTHTQPIYTLNEYIAISWIHTQPIYTLIEYIAISWIHPAQTYIRLNILSNEPND